MSPPPVQRSRPPATAEPFVGRAMRRTEDRRFVTGRGCFVDDFIRADLTHAVLVRSAHAHVRVSRIDTTRARALPGVLEEVPSTLNPLGAKGTGEGGIVATGAAASNAVAAALASLGVIVRDLPLSPANITRWIRDARRGG